jgi:hypothetical protein
MAIVLLYYHLAQAFLHGSMASFMLMLSVKGFRNQGIKIRRGQLIANQLIIIRGYSGLQRTHQLLTFLSYKPHEYPLYCRQSRYAVVGGRDRIEGIERHDAIRLTRSFYSHGDSNRGILVPLRSVINYSKLVRNS